MAARKPLSGGSRKAFSSARPPPIQAPVPSFADADLGSALETGFMHDSRVAGLREPFLTRITCANFAPTDNDLGLQYYHVINSK